MYHTHMIQQQILGLVHSSLIRNYQHDMNWRESMLDRVVHYHLGIIRFKNLYEYQKVFIVANVTAP